MQEQVEVDVAGVRLSLSNLDKSLYPEFGFRKRDVVSYYQRVAEVLLPHVRDRAATLLRFPEGVDGTSFFEKNVGRHAPSWVDTVPLVSGADGSGNESNEHIRINDLPTLIWASNLAALELHVPQWTVEHSGLRHAPDLLVFDLDPGKPATVVDCCRVAKDVREVLSTDGLRPYPKTSGSKGLQIYCPVSTTDSKRTSEYAKQLAQRMENIHPDRVVSKMARDIRRGKVFIDWSQNNPAKTTIAPYSLRGRTHPTISTPVTWAEVRACTRPHQLVFTAPQVLDRIDSGVDPFADLHADPIAL